MQLTPGLAGVDEKESPGTKQDLSEPMETQAEEQIRFDSVEPEDTGEQSSLLDHPPPVILEPEAASEKEQPASEAAVEEQKVIVEDLPDKPYTHEIMAAVSAEGQAPESSGEEATFTGMENAADDTSPQASSSADSWVVMENKTESEKGKKEKSPDSLASHDKTDLSADAKASEIVEDMLTLMRPRPASNGIQEAHEQKGTAEPVLDAIVLKQPAESDADTKEQENTQASDGQRDYQEGEQGFFDAAPPVDDDVDFPGRSNRFLWFFLVVIIGAGVGYGAWRLVPILGQSGGDAATNGLTPVPMTQDGGTRSTKGVSAKTKPNQDGKTTALASSADAGIKHAKALSVDAGVGLSDAGSLSSATGDQAVKADSGQKLANSGKPSGGDKKTSDENQPADDGSKTTAQAGVDMEYAKLLSDGQAFMKARKYRKAIKVLKKASEMNDKDSSALVALANAYFEMGYDGKAIIAARKALKIDPKNGRAYLTLGTIYQTADQNAKARRAYHNYLKLDPKDKSAAEVRKILKNL